MKQPSFITLTFCAIVIASTNAIAEPKPDTEKNVSVALLTGESFSWTGFYIGGNLGATMNTYDFKETGLTIDTVKQFNDATDSSIVESGLFTLSPNYRSQHDGSIMGGGQIGFMYQFGHFVVGVEGDVDRMAVHQIARADTLNSGFFTGQDIPGGTLFANSALTSERRVETNWNASARLVLGWAHGPFLFYGTAGAAWTDITVWSTDSLSTNFFVNNTVPPGLALAPAPPPKGSVAAGSDIARNTSRDDQTPIGWTAGGGIAIALTDMLTIGLEYRHSDYGDDTYHFNSHGGSTVPGSNTIGLSTDQVTVRANLLLNRFFGHDNYAGYAAAANDGKGKGSSKDRSVAMVQEEPFNWTGLYLGAHAGGVWNSPGDFNSFDSKVNVFEQFFGFVRDPVGPQDIQTFHTPSTDAGSDSSIIGGGQVGYNFQFGHFVFGLEGDFSGLSTSSASRFTGDSAETTFFFDSISSSTQFTARRTVETTWEGSARGRLGYAHGPVLLYLTGGAAFAHISVLANDGGTTRFFVPGPPDVPIKTRRNPSLLAQGDDVAVGWTGGGGMEWAANQTWSVGLEYRHSAFGDSTFNLPRRNAFSSSSLTRLSMDSDQVTFRINVLLGHVMAR